MRTSILAVAALLLSSALAGPGSSSVSARPAVRQDRARIGIEAIATYFKECSVDELLSGIRTVRDVIDDRLLTPDPRIVKDHAAMAVHNQAGVNRLLERGVFEGLTTGRGGGAYFSFTTRTNDYDRHPDIELQQGRLSSGFAGGDCGLVEEVSAASIADVSLDDVRRWELMTPAEIRQIARAQRPPQVVVGQTYVVRSIRWDESDTLAALEVLQRDDHGITFAWKILSNLPKPRRNHR